MINEEDITSPVLSYVEDILKGKEEALDEMPTFLHVGESHNRQNWNIIDSILLKSKRIGHGFEAGFCPKVVKKLVENDICLECCPVSNRLLGYTKDLRNHPVRFLINQGVQISISSDDPGFFGYDGVAVDFTMLVLAWELDIRDLKKLALNGITYASIPEEKKQQLKDGAFKQAWDEFINKFTA